MNKITNIKLRYSRDMYRTLDGFTLEMTNRGFKEELQNGFFKQFISHIRYLCRNGKIRPNTEGLQTVKLMNNIFKFELKKLDEKYYIIEVERL